MIPHSVEQLKAIEALYSHAYTLYQKGHYAHARDFFQLLTLVSPEKVNHWMGFGACLQLLKEYKKALEAYEMAALLEDTDTNPLPHFHAAECLFILNEKERAFQALESAEKIAKTEKNCRTLCGQLALIRQQWSA